MSAPPTEKKHIGDTSTIAERQNWEKSGKKKPQHEGMGRKEGVREDSSRNHMGSGVSSPERGLEAKSFHLA